MKKPLLTTLISIIVLMTVWLLSHPAENGDDGGTQQRREARQAASPLIPLASTREIDTPLPANKMTLPEGWSPLLTSKLELAPDLAQQLKLTDEQIRHLGIFRQILLSEIGESMSRVEFTAIPLPNTLGGVGTAESVSETAIFFPAQRKEWQRAEVIYKMKLDTILGVEKASVFREAARAAVTPLTGDFGRVPQLGIVALKNGIDGQFYRWTISTGAQAFASIAGNHLPPNGLTAEKLESQLISGPSFSAAENFTNVPEYLNRLFVAP